MVFKSLIRKIKTNPLKVLLKKAHKKGHTRFLLGWNRGLGDIALGLYPLVYQIKQQIPQAKITFGIRENLKEGFDLFEGVDYFVCPDFQRKTSYDVQKSAIKLGKKVSDFDVIINWPDPTWWVKHLRGKVTPRLQWKKEYDLLYQKFFPNPNDIYVGVQMSAETDYGHWRNWPKEHWGTLFDLLEKKGAKVLLFGYGNEEKVDRKNVIDLRSKTNLFELLSLIKNVCSDLILPDSGILSMAYYLDAAFPLNVISLWADPHHGILKQKVNSPNPQLTHRPLIGAYKNLKTVTAEHVFQNLMLRKK